MLRRLWLKRVPWPRVGRVRDAFHGEPRQAFQIGLPILLALATEVLQEGPTVEAGIVAVIEMEADCVMPHRFHLGNSHMLLADLQYFLAWPVSANFR